MDYLARVGYDSDFGARPLKRAIRRHIEDALSVMLIQDRFGKGSRIRISFDEKDQKVEFAEDTAGPAGAAAKA